MKYTQDNEREVFYEELLDNPHETDLPEVVDIISNKKERSGFYELCQKFVDIALNADKIVSDDKMDLMCCSKFVDIDRAAIAVQEFVKVNNIDNISGLLDMIKERYAKSVSINETRQKSGVLPPPNNTPYSGAIGYAGKWYYFLDIPTWEQVKEDILNKARKTD
ncbi:hypothetical protein JCM15765_03240 [Paradesulfitobacterium aromaticivorans]